MVTLHVCDYSTVDTLHDQIQDGNNSTFNGFKNYFLIYVPNNKASNKEKIE